MFYKEGEAAAPAGAATTLFKTAGAKIITTGAIALNVAAGIGFAAAALTF